jgi:hypothetical protein
LKSILKCIDDNHSWQRFRYWTQTRGVATVSVHQTLQDDWLGDTFPMIPRNQSHGGYFLLCCTELHKKGHERDQSSTRFGKEKRETDSEYSVSESVSINSFY